MPQTRPQAQIGERISPLVGSTNEENEGEKKRASVAEETSQRKTEARIYLPPHPPRLTASHWNGQSTQWKQNLQMLGSH